MKRERKTPRPQPKSFYLGAGDDAERRLSRIEEIAKELGVTRSVLLQKIADGEFEVRPVEKTEQ